jgi:MoaA/NifB/PqqE/SkfB family radical SAM enzyme
VKTRDLRLLILHVSTRCDQTCAHCSIWRSTPSVTPECGLADRLGFIEAAASEGATTVLFTGGEPLLCDHIEALARRAKALGLTVHLATNGLGLGRAASWVGECVDEVFVSLEGPADIHDRVRGPRMTARLQAALGEVARLARRPRLVARNTLTGLNASALEGTVAMAREMGFDAVSFLPVDTSSSAFGGRPAERGRLRPGAADVAALRRSILYLASAGELGGFVLESEEKLMSMTDALALAPDRVAPRCNAPEWSVVVEADGALRPCFFQPAVAAGRGSGLGAARRSEPWAKALEGLGPQDATCSACVCAKYLETQAPSIAERAARTLGASLPGWLPRMGAA